MKTAIQAIFLSAFLRTAGYATDPQATAPENNEAAQKEQRWLTILPDLFADEAKKHNGAQVRFSTNPFTQISAGSVVTIKSSNGTTVRVSNVSNAARRDIATPHKPPAIVTVEGVITAIDATKRTVSVKATKVDVRWPVPPPEHLRIRFKNVKPRIDRLLDYETNRDSRRPWVHDWRLPGYHQGGTGLTIFVKDGYITHISYQFYLGFDAQREAHYQQSLPALRGLFAIFMPSLKLTEEQIHQHLQKAKTERTAVKLMDSEGKFMTAISYKFDRPEDADRYRSFVVDFGQGPYGPYWIGEIRN